MWALLAGLGRIGPRENGPMEAGRKGLGFGCDLGRRARQRAERAVHMGAGLGLGWI